MCAIGFASFRYFSLKHDQTKFITENLDLFFERDLRDLNLHQATLTQTCPFTSLHPACIPILHTKVP
jgi:SUMO ligase MMS21 Smc5/6 complex component